MGLDLKYNTFSKYNVKYARTEIRSQLFINCLFIDIKKERKKEKTSTLKYNYCYFFHFFKKTPSRATIIKLKENFIPEGKFVPFFSVA